MNRILILFAHPTLEKSRVQYRLIKAAQSIDDIYLHDLYELYPDFMIDVDLEQELLRNHDIILFQHPFYWYSCPALLKEWLDLVLEHGFAYGKKGTALQGKKMANIISTGGSKKTYCSEGHNQFTIQELLRPFEQSANLCGMTYLPPFVVHGTHNMTEATIDNFADQYRTLLLGLQSGALDMKAMESNSYLNDWNSNQV